VAIAAAIAVKWFKDLKRAIKAEEDSRDGKYQRDLTKPLSLNTFYHGRCLLSSASDR
jgi:hypothetical protein